MTPAEKRTAIDDLITALNNAKPAVFALMDYWTFDGWLALKQRLKEAGAPALHKTVFPGIELRLISPTAYRLNAHVVFADDINDQDLIDFKARLTVGLVNQPLSDACLVRLARKHIGADQLGKLGYAVADVTSDDRIALEAGSKAAEITAESYKFAIEHVPDGKALGFMPWDTNDGLAHADWEKHYAYVLGLMQSSPIFETRKPDQWAAFTGVKTSSNKKWIGAFQAALKDTPRLAVCGSDAHSLADYGVFPGGKAAWIKADPTFLGLLQAIKEPAKRSFIGEIPEKLRETESNKTFFVDSVCIAKEPGSVVSDHWLDSCSLPLNCDLVAIIGNKGSGKSALADVIALLGNSRQHAHFSFLHRLRFRAKPRELAHHFRGTIVWKDGTAHDALLSDDPDADSVELIRYIPQAHFEKLCNDHVSGESDVFEAELRSVIFSHTDASIRQGALDFEQLIKTQEAGFRVRLTEYRKDLKRVNAEIEAIEAQLQPQVLRGLLEFKHVKEKQIEEHQKIKPPVPPPLTEKLSPAQQAAADELHRLTEQIKRLDEELQVSTAAATAAAAKTMAIQAIRDRLKLLQRQSKQLEDETAADLRTLGIPLTQLLTVEVRTAELDKLASALAQDQSSRTTDDAARVAKRKTLAEEMALQTARLNEPQQRYQRELGASETWQAQLTSLIGSAEQPETLKGTEARIAQLEALPPLLQEKQALRRQLASEVYGVLAEQRKARQELFSPVQELISNNALIREEYKLQFQASLSSHPDTLSSKLFELVKQSSGDFRGADDSIGTVRRIVEKHDLDTPEGALAFVDELYEKIKEVAGKEAYGISGLLRRGHTAAEVYDLLFGLSFLEPRYTLLFQDAQIAQLSPG
ncbi:MAG: hypothetical protein WC655_29010, partial [Candidatus Hydrogenedentales bacterium]